MEFEWDAAKAASNLQKHGVSFAHAAGIFRDGYRYEEIDLNQVEERWSSIGLVDGAELTVIYMERNDRVRLISARKAESHERRQYWQNRLLHVRPE